MMTRKRRDNWMQTGLLLRSMIIRERSAPKGGGPGRTCTSLQACQTDQCSSASRWPWVGLWAVLYIIGASVLGLACGDGDVGIPQPIPIPAPEHSKLRATWAPFEGSGSIHVVGLPGTVPGPGLITVENAGLKEESTATDSGSFSLQITAEHDDILQLRYKNGFSATQFRVAREPVARIEGPPEPLEDVPPVSPGSTSGMVLIRGISPDTPVLGVNLELGAVVTTDRAADATFQLEIAAQPGNHIRLYVDQTILGPWWEVTVP